MVRDVGIFNQVVHLIEILIGRMQTGDWTRFDVSRYPFFRQSSLHIAIVKAF